MKLSPRFYVNFILTLCVIGVAIAGFMIDDLLNLTFNVNYEEPVLEIPVYYAIEIHFHKKHCIANIIVKGKELADIMNIDKNAKIAEHKIQYNKINDIDYLFEEIMNPVKPILDAMINYGEEIGILVVNKKIDEVTDLFKKTIEDIISNKQKLLNQIKDVAEKIQIIINVVMSFFIVIGLYLLSGYRFAFISIILFLTIFVLAIAFTIIVFFLSTAIEMIEKHAKLDTYIDDVKPGLTLKLYLANLYLALGMFVVNWGISGKIRRNRNKSRSSSRR